MVYDENGNILPYSDKSHMVYTGSEGKHYFLTGVEVSRVSELGGLHIGDELIFGTGKEEVLWLNEYLWEGWTKHGELSEIQDRFVLRKPAK